MTHEVSLEQQIILSRKVKNLKAHKDRLLDALRDLVASIATADATTPKQEDALDKALRALELHDAESNKPPLWKHYYH
jgi:hypothetical protein